MKGNVTTILAVCPIRARPQDSSEMISQILFGEQATVTDKYKGDWLKIILRSDGYEGWVDRKQMILGKDRAMEEVALNLEIFYNIFSDDKSTWITIGSELAKYDGITTVAGGHKFRFSGQAVFRSQLTADGESIEKIARRLINTPYLWGGRSPVGIDCSGFTQLVFKCVGISIKRDSSDQATQGTMIDFVSAAKPGDLAFFTKTTDKISHVGIMLPDRQIIHASGYVRVDKIDHYGIFNIEIQEYTHRLKIIKRYF